MTKVHSRYSRFGLEDANDAVCACVSRCVSLVRKRESRGVARTGDSDDAVVDHVDVRLRCEPTRIVLSPRREEVQPPREEVHHAWWRRSRCKALSQFGRGEFSTRRGVIKS